METGLKAVIFDLDGVITDTAAYHYQAWKQLADELGIYFDEQINERLKGIDRMTSLEIILERSMVQYTQDEKVALATKKNENYKQLVQTMTPADVLPGALEVLKLLKQRGIKAGLASVSKNAFTVIDKLQVGEYFNYIADAAKITKGKPDPEIFLTVAENLGVSPQECVGVEDAVAGMKAIKAAGMYGVGVGDPIALKEADEVIPGLDWFDLESLLSRFAS